MHNGEERRRPAPCFRIEIKAKASAWQRTEASLELYGFETKLHAPCTWIAGASHDRVGEAF